MWIKSTRRFTSSLAVDVSLSLRVRAHTQTDTPILSLVLRIAWCIAVIHANTLQFRIFHGCQVLPENPDKKRVIVLDITKQNEKHSLLRTGSIHYLRTKSIYLLRIALFSYNGGVCIIKEQCVCVKEAQAVAVRILLYILNIDRCRS